MTNSQNNFAQNPGNTTPETTENFVIWYFVTVPVTQDGAKYAGKPISPNFRTEQEARQFLTDNNFIGARVCQQAFVIKNDTERAEIEAELFNGANPGIPIGYMP